MIKNIKGKTSFRDSGWPLGPLSGSTFGGVFESRPIGAGVAPRPNMGAQNSHLSKLVKTGIAGVLRIDLGLLSIRVLCFSKSDEKLRSYGPHDAVREIACGA